MPIDVHIIGAPDAQAVQVTPDGALLTDMVPAPPFGYEQSTVPFQDFLRNSAGSSDMRVDGSVTPIDFVVEAPQENDRYVANMAFTIADAGAVLNEFGNIGALSNGCSLFYSEITLGEIIVVPSLTTNFAFVRLAGGEPAFGTGNDSFRANNVLGMSEGFIPILNLMRTFGVPLGIRLKGGTTERIGLRINDDVTGVDEFTCAVFGFDRLKPS